MRRLPLAVLVALLIVPLAQAQPTDESTQQPTEVEVGLRVINFGNYDANKGTYLLDFYLFFRWDPAVAPPSFSPASFEFMNGRASAKDKIFDDTIEGGERELWYRIQANLYSEPKFNDYPFDTQTVQIVFEDSNATSSRLVYVPLHEESGLDEGFNAGWRVHEPSFEIVDKDCKFDETYSRVRFSVDLSRERFSTGSA